MNKLNGMLYLPTRLFILNYMFIAASKTVLSFKHSVGINYEIRTGNLFRAASVSVSSYY